MPPVDENAVPFYVIGEVMTENGALQPKLAPAVPQGINPANLILDLTIEKVSEVGTADMNFRDVRYDANVKQGQYSDVTIRFGSEDVATIPVQVVR